MFKPISTNILPVLCGVSLAKLAAPMMNFNPGGQLTMPIRPGVEGKVMQSGINRRGQPYLIVEGPEGPYIATQGRRGLRWLKIPKENVARIRDYTPVQQFGGIWQAQQLSQWAPRFGLGGGGAMDPQTAFQMEMLRLLKEELQRYQQAGSQQGGQVPEQQQAPAQQQSPTQPELSQPMAGQQEPVQQPTETTPQTSPTIEQPQGGQAPAAQPAAEQTAFTKTPFTQPVGFTPPKAPKLTPPQLPQTKLRSTLESPQWA